MKTSRGICTVLTPAGSGIYSTAFVNVFTFTEVNQIVTVPTITYVTTLSIITVMFTMRVLKAFIYICIKNKRKLLKFMENIFKKDISILKWTYIEINFTFA